MNKREHKNEVGAVSGALIAVILLGLGVVILAGLSVYLFMQYNEQKSNVDSKVDVAVAEARRDQAEIEEKKFLTEEKEPNRTFVGPDDYGRVSFDYPKTWSVYVADDASNGGDFEAYLNPISVPQVGGKEQRYALRVTVENQSYSDVIDDYQGQVSNGELKNTTFTASGQSGTRYDGLFSNDIRGSAVIFKVRDKTLSIFTDANTFKPDFDKIIKTIEFNS